MYLDFYNLHKEPFHVTPDPYFFYLSPTHKEAFASMIYGLMNRKGFIAVIGEVGLGKTTVVRTFLEKKTDTAKIKTIFVFNPNVSFKGLLKIIYDELGINLPASKENSVDASSFKRQDPLSTEADHLSELVQHLHTVLIKEFQQGYNIVLIIDEAQNMPVQTLENLRMLSNLETAQDKLLQIFLIGQPEFERKLNLKELRQLKQRIAVYCILKPLNRKQVYHYIHHRLYKAGARGNTIFTRNALRLIYKYSQGIPRKINILCDNALINGFGYEKAKIDAKIIKEVHAEQEGSAFRTQVKWSLILPLALLLIGGGLGASLYKQPIINKLNNLITQGDKNFPVEEAAENQADKKIFQLQKKPLPKAINLYAIDTDASQSSPPKQRLDATSKVSNSNMLDQTVNNSFESALTINEQKIHSQLKMLLPTYESLSDVRKKVLIEMAKQTSIQGLMTFEKMLAALKEKDFNKASREMVLSFWCSKVGTPAYELAKIMKSNKAPHWNTK